MGLDIYIKSRHATAQSNVARREANKENDKEAKKKIKTSIEYFDSMTVPEAEHEITALSEQLSNYNIEICLISPMRRALHTAFGSLKNHKNFQNIKFILCPLALPVS